jgi:hypothetical protein
MAKILHFKTPRDNVIEALEKLLQHAKDGDLTGFVFAAKCPDGNIATSWSEVDVGTRGELNSHLQIDIMYDVMAANMDRLVEYV